MYYIERKPKNENGGGLGMRLIKVWFCLFHAHLIDGTGMYRQLKVTLATQSLHGTCMSLTFRAWSMHASMVYIYTGMEQKCVDK